MSSPVATHPSCFRPSPGGVEVDVLVQPRASRSRVLGLHDGRLKVQLAAPPVDGEANAALRELMADAVGLPLRQVVLLRGETSRRKTIRIEGASSAANVQTSLLAGAP